MVRAMVHEELRRPSAGQQAAAQQAVLIWSPNTNVYVLWEVHYGICKQGAHVVISTRRHG